MIYPADGPELSSLREAARNLDPSPEQRDRMWKKFSEQAAGLRATPRDGFHVRARWLVGALLTGVAILTAAGLRVGQRRARARSAHGDEPGSEK